MLFRVLALMTIMMPIGVIIGVFVSPSVIDKTTPLFEIVVVGIKHIPSWFGAIAGIFGSTFLSYFYAIEKQQRDDDKKEHEENVKNASKALMTIVECIEQLKEIQNHHIEKIGCNKSINRCFKTLSIVQHDIEKAKVDISSLYFLIRKKGGNTVQFRASNPIFIHATIRQYNDIITLLKEKKQFGDKVMTDLYEDGKCEIMPISLAFNMSDLHGTKSYQQIMYFIMLSETLFKRIEDNLDTLFFLANDLSSEIISYIDLHNLKKLKNRAMQYHSDYHFITLPSIDVETEIKKLAEQSEKEKIKNQFVMRQWPVATTTYY